MGWDPDTFDAAPADTVHRWMLYGQIEARALKNRREREGRERRG